MVQLEALSTNGRIFGAVLLVGLRIFYWVKMQGKSPPEQTTLNADVNQDQMFDYPVISVNASIDINLGTRKESHPKAIN